MLVEDMSHYEQLLQSAIKKGRYSNCFLLPSEVPRLCKEQKLYYSMDRSGVFFFKKSGSGTSLMLVVDAAWFFFDVQKFSEFLPIKCDFPANNGKYGSSDELCMERLAEAGFEVCSDVKRTVYYPEAVMRTTFAKVATVDMAKSILSLWEATFVREEHDLPDYDELVPHIEKGHVFYCSDEDNSLTGAILYKQDGKTGWVWHLAVRPDKRGMGIGQELMAMAHQKGINAGVRIFRGWVNVNNTSPKGYVHDGRTIRRMLRREIIV